MYCDQRVYVCLFVCLSVRLHISKTTRSNFNEFSVHVACHHDSIVLWQQCNIYVLPVLWMTPCFHIMEPNRSESKTTRMFCSVRQLAAPRVKYAVFDCMLLNAEKDWTGRSFVPSRWPPVATALLGSPSTVVLTAAVLLTKSVDWICRTGQWRTKCLFAASTHNYALAHFQACANVGNLNFVNAYFCVRLRFPERCKMNEWMVQAW